MSDYEINALGQRLGLVDGLQVNDNGLVSLQIDAVTFTIEKSRRQGDTCLLLSVARQVLPSEAAFLLEKALKKTSWEKRLAYPTSAALYRDSLILAVTLAENEATAETMENCLRFLLSEIESLARPI